MRKRERRGSEKEKRASAAADGGVAGGGGFDAGQVGNSFAILTVAGGMDYLREGCKRRNRTLRSSSSSSSSSGGGGGGGGGGGSREGEGDGGDFEKCGMKGSFPNEYKQKRLVILQTFGAMLLFNEYAFLVLYESSVSGGQTLAAIITNIRFNL